MPPQLFGYDFMIDDDMNVMLLEINSSCGNFDIVFVLDRFARGSQRCARRAGNSTRCVVQTQALSRFFWMLIGACNPVGMTDSPLQARHRRPPPAAHRRAVLCHRLRALLCRADGHAGPRGRNYRGVYEPQRRRALLRADPRALRMDARVLASCMGVPCISP